MKHVTQITLKGTSYHLFHCHDLIELIRLHMDNNVAFLVENEFREMEEKYEEILEFFIKVNYFKQKNKNNTRKPIEYDLKEVKKLISTIPFELTSDQKLVCNEIFKDFKARFINFFL